MPERLHVGAQPPQLGVHVVVVGVELIELGVDLLGLARRREHRHHDQQQQTAEAERRHRPRFQPHRDLRTPGQAIPVKITPFVPLVGIPPRPGRAVERAEPRDACNGRAELISVDPLLLPSLPANRPTSPVDRIAAAAAGVVYSFERQRREEARC